PTTSYSALDQGMKLAGRAWLPSGENSGGPGAASHRARLFIGCLQGFGRLFGDEEVDVLRWKRVAQPAIESLPERGADYPGLRDLRPPGRAIGHAERRSQGSSRTGLEGDE